MTEQYTAEKMDSILGKIRALIANADDPATPDEARDAYRQRADALMFKYRVDEATMVASGQFGGSMLEPALRVMVLGKAGSEFEYYYRDIAGAVMFHCGVRALARYSDGNLTTHAVGYPSDLAYADLLMTAALIEFGKRLEPKPDPGLSFEENCYRMRAAGMERWRIAGALLGSWTTQNEMKAKNRKVTRAVRLYAAQNGLDAEALLGRGNNMGTYRQSYADGFVQQLRTRLARMRQANGEESATLVLADRKERVDEKFYEHFPRMRPQEPTPGSTSQHVSRADCDKCKKAKSGYCRAHAYLRPRAYRDQPYSGAAYRAGQSAANMVDLGGSSTGTRKPTHTQRKEIN